MSEEKTDHSNIDIIKGDPKIAIRKLALPMMISMLLMVTYNLADSIWVSGLGAAQLAAIGFISPLFMVMVGFGNGIGAGANSLIARCIGADDKATADNAALHSVIITIILSIIIPLILVPILKPILLIMGAGASVQYGLEYGNIVFGFMFVFIFAGVGAAILRSEGDVNRAMYIMAITSVLNIVIDPIFIYILNMGIAGAAWASVLSSFISCLVMIYWMWIKKDTYLDLRRKAFNYKNFIVKDILLVAIPATMENLVMSIQMITMNYLLVLVATISAVAAFTSGMRVIQVAMVPLIGIGTAVLTVAGASYGAKNYDKLKTGFHYSIKLGLLMSSILGVILFIFAPQISIVFSYTGSSAHLAPLITDVIRVFSIYLFTLPIGIMSSSFFQGLGKGTTSLIVTIFRSLIFQVICSYSLGIIMGLGAVGIYSGIVIGGTLGGIFSLTWAELILKRLRSIFQSK